MTWQGLAFQLKTFGNRCNFCYSLVVVVVVAAAAAAAAVVVVVVSQRFVGAICMLQSGCEWDVVDQSQNVSRP